MAIDYERVNWDTTKFVNPSNMNQMDLGIKNACDGVDALEVSTGEIEEEITAINTKLTQYETIDGTTDAYAQLSLGKDYNIKSLLCLADRKFASYQSSSSVRITDQTGAGVANTRVKVVVGYTEIS